LVSGFVLRADRPLQAVSWDDMGSALDCDDGMVWLHFDLSDARSQRWLAACERIPQSARDVLLASDNRVRLESTGNGLVGVLGDLHHDFHHDPSEVSVLRLYLDDRCLISARRRPLKAVDGLRRAVSEGLRVERPVSLIIHLLNDLADALGAITLELAESIDTLEDRILAGRIEDRGGELGRLRRLAARLRWHIVPQRHALIRLLDSLPSWLSKPDLHGLRRAIERLEAVSHDLDLVQERARLLQDELGTHQREVTNRNVYVLSMVTAIFLPITLITGIFGMNVGGLPGVQEPDGFWWVILGMAGTVVATLLILRWKRLF